MGVFASLGRTQQRLLQHLLRSARGASVEQLTSALEVTHNAVRQHLTALMERGLVERAATRRTGGRPEQLYALTDLGREIFPRRYAQLAVQLLAGVSETLGPEATRMLLQRLGRSTGEQVAAELPADAGTPSRTEAIARLMSELGYDAHAVLAGPRVPPQIVAHNCVFHQLAARHPEVCSFDLALLERATGGVVEHAECIIRGGTCCRFRLRGRELPG